MAGISDWSFSKFKYWVNRLISESDSGSGGSGAPTDAQYITLATDGDLSAERVLTAGDNISLTDAGAGGTLTIAATGGGTAVDDENAIIAQQMLGG